MICMELVDYLKLLIPHKDYWREECDSGLFLVICWRWLWIKREKGRYPLIRPEEEPPKRVPVVTCEKLSEYAEEVSNTLREMGVTRVQDATFFTRRAYHKWVDKAYPNR